MTILLNTEQKDLLIGTLLGDGHLATKTNGSTWVYRAKQGEKQKDYLFHKFQILQSLCREKPPRRTLEFKKGYDKTYVCWYFYTKTMTDNVCFGQKFYSLNETTQRWVKDVPQDIETYLSPRAIAYWFMDDGTLNKKWRDYKTRMPAYYFDSLIFCTNSFSLAGVMRLQKVFKQLYDLNVTIQRKSSKSVTPQYLLRFSNKEALRLKVIIKPFVIPSMSYKLDF